MFDPGGRSQSAATVSFRVARVLIALSCYLAPQSVLVAQARHDVIRGRVTRDRGQPMPAARIVVTRAPDRAIFEATTDSTGRFAIAIDSGAGDYLLYIAVPRLPELQTFRKRLTATGESDSVFVVDVDLATKPSAQEMAAVTIRARKPTPSRNEDLREGPATGESERRVEGMVSAFTPEQRSDIASMAGTVPGIITTGIGNSILGVSPTQNITTLNGLSFAGSSVPREAQTALRVVTSTYDPSRGWFGGAETAITLRSGFLFSGRSASIAMDSPPLDATQSALSGRTVSRSASAATYGVTDNLRASFNLSAQVSATASDAAGIVDRDERVLERAGVSPDSAARFLGLLGALGIPVGKEQRGATTTTRTSFLAGVSSAPVDPQTGREVDYAGGVVVYGFRERIPALLRQPLAVPASDASATRSIGSVQGTYSTFLTPGILQEFRSSVNFVEQNRMPALELPGATVLTASTIAGAVGGLTPLTFGGASAGELASRSLSWEGKSDTRFYLRNRPEHRLRLTATVRFDDQSERSTEGENGFFSFLSLADLAANRPSVFTRTLTAPNRYSAVWNGAISLGDYWRATPSLEFLYGGRIEGNLFSEKPAYNPAVEAVFGARNNFVPNAIHVSPRLGFSWIYDKTQTAGRVVENDHGRFFMPPFGVLRGGIGEFRSLIAPSLVEDAASATGLPGSLSHITCVGDAIPTPNWTLYSASPGTVPSRCTASSGQQSFQDGAPPVRLLDPGYNSPRSWRANLSWTSHFEALSWTVEGIYSANVNQAGRIDLNFRGIPQFSTSDESRPVFVVPSHIVPASGAVTTFGARRDSAFGPVLMTRTDLRSEARQLAVTFTPDLVQLGRSALLGSVTYVLSDTRSFQRGFDGATFGNPQGREWSRGNADARHAVLFQAGARAGNVTFSMYGKFLSGVPFTPMVGGDVNGDGIANDRAFIFDPDRAKDAGVSSALRALLSGSASSIRQCLANQLGQRANRNSCEGPWTAELNAAVRLSPQSLPGWGRRLAISLYFTNPLGGIDRVMHGAKTQGWGNPAHPDPILYRLNGFDAGSQRFIYSVNPRFGSTRPQDSYLTSPFRVTLDVRMDLGIPIDVQFLDRSLRPGRNGHPGNRRTVDQIQREYRRMAPDPFSAIVSQTDSLLLKPDQVRALLESQRRYSAKADSVVKVFASWMAGLPDNYDASAALVRQGELLDELVNVGREAVQADLPGILNPIQRRLLPWPANLMLRARGRIKAKELFSAGGA